MAMRMRGWAASVAVLVFFAGCAPAANAPLPPHAGGAGAKDGESVAVNDTPPSRGSPSGKAEGQAACEARGGNWRQVGMMGLWTCVTAMPDAGKVCSDRSDCTGQCIYEGAGRPPAGVQPQGRCQRTSVQFGCFTYLEKGQARAICVD
jgi:hypothetical protein